MHYYEINVSINSLQVKDVINVLDTVSIGFFELINSIFWWVTESNCIRVFLFQSIENNKTIKIDMACQGEGSVVYVV